MVSRQVSVGIVGGSGYSGGELLRLLLTHPQAQVAWVTSRGDKPLETIHRNLLGSGLRFITEEEAPACDVAFLCMPSRESMGRAERYLEHGSKVIDLGSDFRLKDASASTLMPMALADPATAVICSHSSGGSGDARNVVMSGAIGAV